MKKKTFYSILLSLPFILGIYSFTSHITKLDHAEAALKLGEYEKCHEQLISLSRKKLTNPHALYKGYWYLVQEQIAEADDCFAQIDCMERPLLHLETKLARALCSYKLKEWNEMEVHLSEIEEPYQQNKWVVLFKGALAFARDEYAQAIVLWTTLEYDYLEEDQLATHWAPWICKRVLGKEQFEMQLAQALLEENDYLLGRELLERMLQAVPSLPAQNLASLYLGYSYLKEANQYPRSQQDSFYKLAAFYFERTTISCIATEHKESMANQLKARAEQLLMQDSLAEEALLCTLLSLQKWHSLAHLETLSTSIVQQLLLPSSTEKNPLILFLRNHFEGSLFYRMVTEQLTHSLLQEIGKGELVFFSKKLRIMDALLADHHSFQQRCYTLIVSKLDHSILYDNIELKQLLYYLDLLKHLEQSEKNLTQLTVKFLEHSKLFWQERGGEVKATKLMELALEFSPNKQETKETIEHYLTALFDQAEASNLVERLSFIYDALLLFNLKTKRLIDPAVLANHLADAQYRFQTGQFAPSKILSSWVLKLDPHNQEALRLLGLNYYYLGEFQEAIVALQKLQTLDQDSYQALLLSETFSSSDQSHLVQLDSLDSFEADK